MCKKQTSVSHSSTEVEIIALDVGLRMEWYPSSGSLEIGKRSIPFSLKNQSSKKKNKGSWAQGHLWHHTTWSKRTKNQTEAPTTHDS